MYSDKVRIAQHRDFALGSWLFAPDNSLLATE